MTKIDLKRHVQDFYIESSKAFLKKIKNKQKYHVCGPEDSRYLFSPNL